MSKVCCGLVQGRLGLISMHRMPSQRNDCIHGQHQQEPVCVQCGILSHGQSRLSVQRVRDWDIPSERILSYELRRVSVCIDNIVNRIERDLGLQM